MSDVGGAGFTNFLAKGRPAGAGIPASKRRHVWEMYADVRIVNKYLLVYSGLASIALAIMSAVVFSIYTRPPYILTQDQGYIMWRTTEVFRLRPDMVSSYLSMVLNKMYNKVPGSYDLSSIMGLVAPNIIDAFSGKSSGTERQVADQREYFDILEIRRLPKSRFPKFLSFMVKANMSISREGRDAAGNVVTETKAETDYVVVWVEQSTPTPDNPWGLVLVGLEYLKGAEGEKLWSESISLREVVVEQAEQKM
jgi:hypothetical protein